jgi:prophage tail gpP-like protein
MTSDTVTLKVGGQIRSGWTDVSIESSLTEVSASFTLSVTDLDPGQQAGILVPVGSPCTLAIGDTTLITGYVNDVDISYDSQSHGLTFRGRDKTGDLVDCSALVTGVGAWNGISVMDIATQLLAPFGITISSTVADTTKVLAGHAVQMGETVWECLDRAIRQYGVMAMVDGSGNVVLTRPGEGGALAEARLGSNILAASANYSERETFRDYYVLGQFPGASDSYSDPRVTTGASATARDPNVSRYRPLIVQVECNTADMTFLPTRAAWEAAFRSGKGRRFTITVAGWRDANGTLYAPNTMIRLEDDFLGCHETLLVVSVRLSLSDGGQLAEMTLCRKEAFLPAPLTSLPPYENSAGAKP